MMKTLMIAGIVVAASTGAALAQDAAAGEQVFKRLCSPCHDIGPDAKVKLGPPLNAIDGRKAGTFEGFNYSPANKSSGITWNEEAFEKYIRAPHCQMFPFDSSKDNETEAEKALSMPPKLGALSWGRGE